MGLDSYWVRPGEDEVAPILLDPPPALCGGIFSAHGDGSFRGKVYDQFVQEITGETLYRERTPNEVVRQMADALDRWLAANADRAIEEERDVVRMFRAHADAGHDLVGWW